MFVQPHVDACGFLRDVGAVEVEPLAPLLSALRLHTFLGAVEIVAAPESMGQRTAFGFDDLALGVVDEVDKASGATLWGGGHDTTPTTSDVDRTTRPAIHSSSADCW